MSSIWTLLIDTSGSMGEGFTSQSVTNIDPLGEHGAWATKLDAAKELLLRQVKSLRAQDIAVIRFDEITEKVFQGSREDFLKQPNLIYSLTAGGGTNISAALDRVREDVEFEVYRSLSILILTDGLDGSAQAAQAAETLIAKYPFARIDTILIDETDEGRRVAESISINGTVRTATSSISLQNAISDARVESLQSELSKMALVRFQTQQELSGLQLLAPPTLVIVTPDYSLTSATLRNDIAPTIAGIELIGKAKSSASQTEYKGFVSSISQDSPISINLTGLKDAVDLVVNYIFPWRRKNAERLAVLDLRKRELEIELQECEKSFHELEVEKRRLENLRIKLDLEKSKWELAEEIMKKIDPDSQLRNEAREQTLFRILSGIEQLSSTKLEFAVVRDLLELK